MDSSTSLRVAIVGPNANLMPSIMFATRTPEGISTDMPSASSLDQEPPEATPRYRQVTTPLRGSSNGVTTSRRQLGRTQTSLSVITRYEALAHASICSRANTFALG